jgi:hypothetical protein
MHVSLRLLSCDFPFIGGRAVNGWHGGVVEAEIDSKLPAMMGKVVENITDHDVPRRLLH